MTARWRAIDATRGLVMVVMALDHVRDFLGRHDVEATDVAHADVPLFASRWITHFCAPAFFLLAGLSAYLSIRGGRRTVAQAARFLAVRGLVLVVLEQTALHVAWYFHVDYHFMNAGVLFGLGWSMVLLAGLVWLPPRVVLAIGLAIILGEWAIAAPALGDGPLATLGALATRSRDFEPVADYHFFVSYPPIPWLGAMAFGYGLGAWVYAGEHARRGVLAVLGAAFLAGFVALRLAQLAEPAWQGALGFLNVSKYPPSTPFLLLTLGGALLLLAAFERWPRGAWLETYGRVPLFFYVAHIPLIHALAVAYSLLAFGDATWLVHGPVIFWDVPLPGSPADYGLPLPGVWLAWLAFVAAMYPACRWFANRRR